MKRIDRAVLLQLPHLLFSIKIRTHHHLICFSCLKSQLVLINSLNPLNPYHGTIEQKMTMKYNCCKKNSWTLYAYQSIVFFIKIFAG